MSWVGLLSYFGNSFFTPMPEPLKAPQLGQIVWTPVPNLDVHPNVIEAVRQGTGHTSATARWVPLTDNHFRARDGKQLPILSFNLGETEEMIAYKAKRRPTVVVGRGATHLGGFSERPPSHHEEERLVVAPIYGIRSEGDTRGFSEAMNLRVRHLLYKQYFLFAAWRETRTGVRSGGSLEAGIIRFDRLQFVTPSAPSYRAVSLRLADDVLALMHAMLWLYLHAQPTDGLREMRDVLADLMPKNA